MLVSVTQTHFKQDVDLQSGHLRPLDSCECTHPKRHVFDTVD